MLPFKLDCSPCWRDVLSWHSILFVFYKSLLERQYETAQGGRVQNISFLTPLNYVVWNNFNLKTIFCRTNLWCCFPLRTLRLFAGGHRDQRGWGVEYAQVSAGQTERYENRHNSIQYIPISSWIVTRSRTLKDVSSLSGWQHRWHTKLTCMVVLDDLEPSIARLQGGEW